MALQRAPSGSVVDHVANELRRAIHEQRLKPGQRLVERQLAADLGVSHIPVREALARLAEEGLVEHQPRRGSRVATMTAKELGELASIRRLLEEFVAVRVQERLTPASQAELQQLVASMIAAAKARDTRKVTRLDGQFHERLWALADHALLTELAAGLRGRIHAFLRAATMTLAPKDLERHARTHQQLLDAIASGKPDAARAAMADHIHTAVDRIQAMDLGVE
jgi:DNA-binding GntR family transcriptional regulator